ncbi:MAG TPA: GntR family transcriptional regulator [Acidimicrobiia bacterium]|nr:GntR family transcriptional regulator [Acidimicrobiia bacterium]
MPPTQGQPGERAVSRVDRVYEELQAGIISGELAPGTPLRHQELSDAYGVSLIPIREAIRKLEMERLVESIPNRGARVAPISIEDLQDAYATRMAIEGEALRKAVDNVTPAQLAQMRSWRHEMASNVQRRNEAFYELHRQLHFQMYESSGSAWLVHTIEILWRHTERYRHLAARMKPFVEVGDDLHGHILDAIETGDADAAVAALHRDLQRTADLVADAYCSGEAAADPRIQLRSD